MNVLCRTPDNQEQNKTDSLSRAQYFLLAVRGICLKVSDWVDLLSSTVEFKFPLWDLSFHRGDPVPIGPIWARAHILGAS